MKEVITRYTCDVCCKEVKEKELNKVEIPVNSYYDYDGTHITIKPIEICNDCKRKLTEVIREHFAKFRDCGFGAMKDDTRRKG